MNLNPLWPLPDQPPGLRYFRAVSTGPATPLVLSVTTTGETVELGLSYRSTAFLGPEMERVEHGFQDQLNRLGEPP